jgi:hypothetical protein
VKLTGVILLVIGVVGGLICTVPLFDPIHPGADATAPNAEQGRRPNMIVPLALCGVAVVVGGLMVMFGGRGYYVSNNPDVRN